MTANPFFSGQGQKKRLGFSTDVPTAVHQANLRGLTRSCDITKDRPSPLRIIKRSERAQSLDVLRESHPEKCLPYHRQVSPAEDYHRALLSVTKRRSCVKLTPSANIAPEVSQTGRRATPIHDEFTFMAKKVNELALPCSIRTASDESKSSIDNSLWNSFQVADENTRISSFASQCQNELACRNSQYGSRKPSNDTASLQSVLPQVLSPHILVTTDTSGYYDGRRCIWAGIEISGKLSHTYSAETVVGTAAQAANRESIIEHQLDRFFKHGCLYDLCVEILPFPGTSILQVLQQHSSPTAVYSGSSIFILVQVQFNTEITNNLDHGRRNRQRSDELIDDLEAELGNSQISYMNINVSYKHSAFPEYSGPEVSTGVSYLQSQMKTVATASVMQNSFLSRWSPRPSTNMDDLVELISKHWGIERSTGIIRQIELTQPPRKKLVKSQSKPILRQPRAIMSHAHRRRQSAQGFAITRPDPVVLRKPASRKSSATSISANLGQHRIVSITTSAADSTTPLQKEGERVGPGKKKSFGADILRSLTPSLATIYSSAREEPDRGSKDSTLWGWGSWF